MNNLDQPNYPDSRNSRVHSFLEIEPQSGKADILIAVLHGRSGNAVDMKPLATRLGKAVPHASIVIPTAEPSCDVPESPLGRHPPYQRQWFEKHGLTAGEQYEQLSRSASSVEALLDAKLADRGLDRSNLIVVGYSQGGYLSLQLGLTQAPPCRSIVTFGCGIIDPERLRRERRSSPHCTLIHGAQDDILPLSVHIKAVQTLKDMGIEVVSDVHADASHDLSNRIQERLVQAVLDALQSQTGGSASGNRTGRD